jgi:uncharacterized oxidoreductase
MKLTNKTALITGGGSGIGLEIAKIYSKSGYKVLIIGRNGEKLTKSAAGLKQVYTLACDISQADDLKILFDKIQAEFADLSLVVNNAATAFFYHHGENADSFEKSRQEMLTNYLSIIRLNETLLPLLKKQPNAAIVNVTSLLSILPATGVPSYSDSKAALHSYSLSLRHTLAKDTKIKVFELMPPLVNTEFSKEIGGEQNGMPAQDVAAALVAGIENDDYEIYVGQTKAFRDFYFSSPKEAFESLNQD